MKIGVISDIHGNLNALNIALDQLKNCDEIYCLGDICSFGADVNACFDSILKCNNVHMTAGNHEQYAVKVFHHKKINELPREKRSYLKYMTKRLSKQYRAYIEELPQQLEKVIDGKKFVFLHYPWNDEGELRNLPAELPLRENEIKSVFLGIKADYVIFGHTHYAEDITVDGTRYVSFGAVGIPHQDLPTVKFGIIEVLNGEVDIRDYSIPYDVTPTVEKIKKSCNHKCVNEILGIFFNAK